MSLYMKILAFLHHFPEMATLEKYSLQYYTKLQMMMK